MKRHNTRKKTDFSLLGALLLIVALPLDAGNCGQEPGEEAGGNTPSAQQIKNAIRLGNQFQGMAYQQLTPSIGPPVTAMYHFPGIHYIPVIPAYPLPAAYYYPPPLPYYGYSMPYYQSPPFTGQ